MTLPLRKAIFWTHLVAGAIAGLVIALMSFTGVALAFKPQIMQWASQETRHAPPPSPGAARLPLEDILARVRAASPETREARPTAITLDADPNATVAVAFGRAGTHQVNGYTGQVLGEAAPRWTGFFRLMEDLHRWLGAKGENRDLGRAVTGVSNAAFLVLAITGLYLWFPRKWTWRNVRAVLWFKRHLDGKARDFNWHNVIGLWSAPVLIVLTATGMVISYKWASNLVYTVTGSEPPGQPPAPVITPPAPDAKPLALDALVALAAQQAPPWQQITVRLPEGPPPSRADAAPSSTPPAPPPATRPADAVRISVRDRDPWPLFASPQLTFDPYTGAVVAREDFAAYSTGHKARRWMRFLHTGEALGVAGQAVAALASLGGLFLVWTGLSLALRRFARWRQRRAASTRSSADLTDSSAEST
ncbi:PepSY-associated TM helix domain-containing protein [Chondromyces apiculatus]|uniref:Iron-regulated membrane protein n=1 Tax=Chondromyces apiculatus DSM 436 TaxID=1192034 RepID=A0A017SW15_9BACT|nr:PepSY-associated TM helix domain-containing protein [Chondromyces apiculatus]EYF01144.1 Hypothetical protein CAP_8567 [Chondromyces apiculatus DSM 436]